jgi:CRP-like cAMP-binding protein
MRWASGHMTSRERQLVNVSEQAERIPSRTVSSSLRQHAFFASLSEPLIARIEDLVYHREYEPRQIIYFPDDPCDHVFWVRRGRVKITRVSGDGRELTFRHLIPGDMFGEECLAPSPKRNAYAEAIEPSLLCLMRADDFLRLVAEEGELSLAMACHLSRRILETELVLSETVFKPVRSRVASGLLRMYERTGRDNDGIIRITHQEIANLVGSTRETTTAVLHGLKKDGIVDMANRRVTILDPVALEHLARSTS